MGDHAPKLHGGRHAEPARKRAAAKRKKPDPTTLTPVEEAKPEPGLAREQIPGES